MELYHLELALWPSNLRASLYGLKVPFSFRVSDFVISLLLKYAHHTVMSKLDLGSNDPSLARDLVNKNK